jgi:hypothetical protein
LLIKGFRPEAIGSRSRKGTDILHGWSRGIAGDGYFYEPYGSLIGDWLYYLYYIEILTI